MRIQDFERALTRACAVIAWGERPCAASAAAQPADRTRTACHITELWAPRARARACVALEPRVHKHNTRGTGTPLVSRRPWSTRPCAYSEGVADHGARTARQSRSTQQANRDRSATRPRTPSSEHNINRTPSVKAPRALTLERDHFSRQKSAAARLGSVAVEVPAADQPPALNLAAPPIKHGASKGTRCAVEICLESRCDVDAMASRTSCARPPPPRRTGTRDGAPAHV